MLRWKRIKPLGGIAAAVVMALALASCDSAPSANPVSDLATTVNSETGSDFKAYDNEAYFGLVYNIEDTPANRARILVLGENSELFEKAKASLLASLEEGHTLAWLVKHHRPLVMAVSAGDAEVHFVYTPEEIRSNVFNK